MRPEFRFDDGWSRASESEALSVQRGKQVLPERLSHVVDMRRVREVDVHAEASGQLDDGRYRGRTEVGTAIRTYRVQQPKDDLARVRYVRSEEHTSELQSLRHLVCRLL